MAAFDRQVKLLQRNGAARAHLHWQEHQQQQTIDANDENRDQMQQQNKTTNRIVIIMTIFGKKLHVDWWIDWMILILVRDALCMILFRKSHTKAHTWKINVFHVACVEGSGPEYIHKALCADASWDGSTALGGVRKLVQLVSSRDMLFRDTAELQSSQTTNEDRCSTYRLVANEEGTLPFSTGPFVWS